jgi:hypothetical protein
MFMEHRSEGKKAVARRSIQKMKTHFGSAYPGSVEEIDRLIAQHGEFVRKLMALIRRENKGWETAEDHILTSYPQLSSRDTEKLAVLVCAIMESSDLYDEDNA